MSVRSPAAVRCSASLVASRARCTRPRSQASSAATAYRRQGLAKEAAGWEGKAAALSAELGPVSLPLLGARSSSGVLTAREAQIARLAADGLSNRQIAARLVVSERTVENHLYRCFTKLSVTSRDQLAQALAGEPMSS